MSTPHNEAEKGQIAKVVLMPGDPLRAKWIAENFLQDAELVNKVRGIYAYTGYYNGKRISVMAHGMGIPSVGIYSYELFKFYDVETIIRVGSTGSLKKEVNLGDVFIASSSTSFSNYADEIGVEVKNNTLYPTKEILDLAIHTAKEQNIDFYIGNVASADAFYNKYTPEEFSEKYNNALVVEMEAFGLYANAIKTNKKALTLLTCSDSLVANEEMTPSDRQTSFNKMIKLALSVAEKIA